MSHKVFSIDALTKVEGHAKLKVEMDGKTVKKTNLEVYEASRYFEAMVRGRDYREAHTITQRICGICSVIHTITSIRAIENALGIKPSQQTTDLRRVLLYSSHIHSHTAHLFMFALPDYLGFSDVIEMSRKRHELMHLALDIQELASRVVRIIGGRPLHPVTPDIGGFHSVPDKQTIGTLRKKLKEAKNLATRAAELFIGLKLPDFERKSYHLSIQRDGVYPLCGKAITTPEGESFRPEDYRKNIKEEIRPYSNAKFAYYKGENYMVGALPRLNVNYKYLFEDGKSLLEESGFSPPIYNPFFNNAAQAIEMVQFADEALRILDDYGNGMKKEAYKHRPKEGEGIAACEAPRGILFHHYHIGKGGKIKKANVITPTSQNVGSMENDIKAFMPFVIKRSDPKIKRFLEMLIRAYDPCFACATHSLPGGMPLTVNIYNVEKQLIQSLKK